MGDTIELSQSKVQTNKYFFAFIAMLIVPLSGLSIDIYVPSLPEVSQYFGVDKALSQLSITAYMLGLGVMQLFAGGISDSFGRKKPFSIAMVTFILATLFIPFAQDIYQLLMLRLIQGITVALVIVPMRAVISDLFSGREFFKMVNYMTMAWSIGPIVAPAIGGYLQHLFGWQACFYFLGAYSILGFLFAFFLPETSPVQHPFHIQAILKRYKEILFHRVVLKGIILNGLLYSMIILFATVGPFLIQNVLHYSPVEFGRVALLIGLAWFLGAMTNRFLIDVRYETKATICLWSTFVIAVITLFATLFLPLSIYLIVIPILMMLYICGIIFPEHFAKGISLFPHAAASASSLFAAIVFLIPAVISSLGTFLRSNSSFPLMAAYVGLIGMCLIIYYVGKRIH